MKFLKTYALLFVAFTSAAFDLSSFLDSLVNIDFDKGTSLFIYYKPHSPTCYKFFKEQLIPTLNSLRDYVQPQFFIYNQPKPSFWIFNYKYTCYDATMECEENLVHACAIMAIAEGKLDLQTFYNFYYCMYDKYLYALKTSLEAKTKFCALRTKVDYLDLVSCIRNRSDVEEFLVKTGEMLTASESPIYPPLVIINSEYDIYEQYDVRYRFKEFMCRKVSQYKPTPDTCLKRENFRE